MPIFQLQITLPSPSLIFLTPSRINRPYLTIDCYSESSAVFGIIIQSKGSIQRLPHPDRNKGCFARENIDCVYLTFPPGILGIKQVREAGWMIEGFMCRGFLDACSARAWPHLSQNFFLAGLELPHCRQTTSCRSGWPQSPQNCVPLEFWDIKTKRLCVAM